MAVTDGLSISFNEVSATATTIRSLNTNLRTDLDNIKKEINNLKSVWDSDAGDLIQTKINGMLTHFEDYEKVIESYAKFLDETVASYQQVEKTNEGILATFQ